MSQADPHPSYLELDRHVLACGAPETAAHVARCARCQAHLDALGAVEPPPAWLAQVQPARAATRKRAAGFGLGGLALAAALYLAVLRPGSPATDYDGAKGGPAIAVHVNREGRVALWDQSALHPGDRIRLEVAPAGFEYVSVFAAGEKLSTMYSGRVPSHAQTLLPKAWLLDAAPGPERVLVMFSHALISEQAADALLKAHDPKDISIVWLTIPKSPR